MGILQNFIILIVFGVFVATASPVETHWEYIREDEVSYRNDDVVVKIPQGELKGSENKTVLKNMKYYSFLGIPYAKPPTGKLRFKDPEPAGKWHGVRDATIPRCDCPQITLDRIVSGEEDCLFLNVYTPQFFNVSKRYPVMVWIHGGGFLFWSSSPEMYGPDLLIEHEIVLVAMNYRLGALGFLSLLNSDVPGNAGLKDQALALHWVKNNIHYFGGDPNRVTIFGESAGSISVQYHMLSPLSRGLFHAAIMESGSVLNPWGLTNHPKKRAFQLGKILGFKNESEKGLFEFLQTVPVHELAKNQIKILDPDNLKQCVDTPFPPTVERVGTGNNFIVEHPRVLLKTGKFMQIPTIIGFNSNEGILALTEAFTAKNSYGYDYGRFVPEHLNLKNDSSDYKKVADDIKQFFFHGQPIDTDHLDEFTEVCSDIAIVNGLYESINYILNSSSTSELYVYEFTFEGKLDVFKEFVKQLRKKLKLPEGVSHADDLGYIFPVLLNRHHLPTNSSELKVVDQITRMWTNFAKAKTPNGEKIETNWKPIKKDHPRYLNISENLILQETIFFPKRTAFWKNIFQKYLIDEQKT